MVQALARRKPYLYEDDYHPEYKLPDNIRPRASAGQASRRQIPRQEWVTEDRVTYINTKGGHNTQDDGYIEAAPAAPRQKAPKRRPQPTERHTNPPVMPVQQLYPQQHKKKRAIFPYVFIGMAIMVFLIWLVGLVIAPFLVTHVSDPLTYGSLRGQIKYSVLASGEKPSKIISSNCTGKILIVIVREDDASRTTTIAGPDLSKVNFPDPTGANTEIYTGDYNSDGHIDIRITIVSTFFDSPFHRFTKDYDFYNDGNGNFKALTM